ncbi:MAG: hypothetical protein A2806_00815 [Candidatus Terrybacteria bacterium RIFCSPHIGHO2_01_FULL_48_17]|uniref:Glycosyl transferase family 1 domain-containing protein n=1 Tax=Candidatus Terrybacteria bacterium RIFCSPHIGHO2_01_FULL_48_17 TaxID=1802362 RepID=A0A1G2PIK8_9BACT|nr:MAG: hypothetical protein A2806_00815 [Candidatus Terrybacteria bacterium RIFCSPHIGHO2_01_FULL_48_17]OHA53878.1 MAG: hypothetical protein A3A30_01415 [Candidatus Terrybacteria bacterium RIFCSPLOWO2_01_FULL_48_14]
MRIGIDARSLEGERTGVGRYLYELLKEWKQTSSIHAQFFLYFKKEIPSDIAKIFGAPSFSLKRLPMYFGHPSNAFFLHVAFPWALRKDHIEHAFYPAYVAPLLSSVPFSVTIHDIVYAARPDLYFWPGMFDRIFLPILSRWSATRAAHIFVPSEFTKTEITRVWYIRKEKTIVTPEGAGEEFFFDETEEDKKRACMRYSILPPFFLFVGSIFTRRHIPECIQAFERIAHEFKDLQFLIAGKDRTRPPANINKRVREINNRLGRDAIKRVDFIDPQLLPAIIQSATAMVWLSDYEGFGLPALEAMAAGTPLITTKNTSLAEVVGDAAYDVSNTRDVGTIERAFRDVLNNEGLRKNMRESGRIRARDFSWKSCAQQTLTTILQTP